MAAAKAAQNEMYTALQNRRQLLVQEFEQKAAYYKSLLIKEMVCVHVLICVCSCVNLCVFKCVCVSAVFKCVCVSAVFKCVVC